MIQTEPTPNPESLKFLSENIISAIGTEEFQKNNIKEINNSFIKELLGFKGVELVLLSKNFLSVKKTQDVSWNELKPMVISHLNHYYKVQIRSAQRFLDILKRVEYMPDIVTLIHIKFFFIIWFCLSNDQCLKYYELVHTVSTS